eukprot:TRINITY_DN14759_c0_g1_i1.p1 TRINITY_DN14759_c0_g1~~TRINITY_DN14759_c0_g1_i1.p1  ORF type:complete len:385 (+),score=48.56 TRINITY_DN14759_c0_g1_i1:123-1157(+)
MADHLVGSLATWSASSSAAASTVAGAMPRRRQLSAPSSGPFSRAGCHGGPMCQAIRGVARVRINRYTGVKAVKVGVPKTQWQIAAEREFMLMRQEAPKNAYAFGLTADDVRNLSPEMQHCLSLKCAGKDELTKWRKRELARKFQRRPFDTGSKAVRIACLTESILRMREHMMVDMKDTSVKRVIQIKLSARHKAMKSLYKTDFSLYKHVCSELGIRCVRYATPDSRHPSKMISPLAVDGDRARFLIRQRLYKRQFAPRRLREPMTNRQIRYTRHPMEPVSVRHGQAKRVPQQVSRAWPYGVREDHVRGKQIVYNPTAAGKGHWPARGTVPGGKTASIERSLGSG